MDKYDDDDNLNKPFPIKTHMGKMESIIDNLSKYLEMLKSEILNKFASDEAFKIEQQFEVIFQCFNELQKEVISVVDNHSREEADTLSNASEETVDLDMTPENMEDDESSALVNVSAIKNELVVDDPSTLNTAAIGEIEHTADVDDDPLRSSARRSPRNSGNNKPLPEICEPVKMHIDDDNNHPCDYCLKVFSTHLELDDHMETHTYGHLSCKECGKRFDILSNLNRHISKVHPENGEGGPHECSICLKVFTEKSAFQKHMEIHPDVARPYECEQCTKCFPKSYLLREHQLVHSGVRAFKCTEPECGKGFFRKQHLREHVTRTHKKKFKCNSENKHEIVQASGKISQESLKSDHIDELGNKETLKSDQIDELGNKETLKSDDIDELGNMAIKSEEENLDDSVDNEEWTPPGKRKSTPRVKRNECDECGKCFRSRYELEEHKPIHTGELPYKCDVCSKAFLRRRFMLAHRRKHAEAMDESESPTRRVSKKPSLGNDQGSLLSERKNSKIVDLKCTYCFEEFESHEELKTHATSHKGIAKKHKCEECGKCFRNRCELEEHKPIHTGELPYKCDVCSKEFLRRRVMLAHRRKHIELMDESDQTGPISKKPSVDNDDADQDSALRERKNSKIVDLKCTYCFEEFESHEELKTHATSHKGVAKKHKCEECGKCFRDRCYLEDHKPIHTGERPYKCDVCSKAFRRRGHLREHVLTHSKRFHCPECPKQYINEKALKRHSMVHTGVKSYICDYCAKTFHTLAGVTRHVKTHTGEGLHPCDQCERVLFSKYELRTHKKYHTGEKLYQCEECGKAFVLNAHLRDHMATHSEEKPHQCSECGKEFKQKCSLTDHMKTHTGKDLVTCQDCGKKYTNIHTLRNHLRKPYACIDRLYDPERHCGVWIADRARECTKSLSCKIHCVSLRRAVQGRRTNFDQLLQQHRRALLEAKYAAEGVYDPNRHCGVWMADQDRHCTQSLACRLHSPSLKRAVPRQTKGYDQLLQEYRDAMQALKDANKAAKCIFDPERHCGVWITDQNRHCTMSLGCKTHPLSQRRAVPGRSKVLDLLLREYRDAKRARQQAKEAEVNFKLQAQRPTFSALDGFPVWHQTGGSELECSP